MKVTLVCICLIQTIFGFAVENNLIEERLRNLQNKGGLVEKKCVTCLSDVVEESSVFVFASFSMPDGVWVSLSPELEKVGGTFLLQGLPSNSFKELAVKIYDLRQKGVNASIQLHPQLFEQYGVNRVPTFVVREGDQWDKLTGTVSLQYALSEIMAKGECQIAKQLLIRLQEEMR